MRVNDIPVLPKVRGLLSAMIAGIGTMLPNIKIFRSILIMMQKLYGYKYNVVTQYMAGVVSGIWRADHSHKTTQLMRVKDGFDKWNPSTGTFEKKVS